MSSLHDLWLFALSLASTGLGWFLRMLWERQLEVIHDLRDLEVKMLQEYVPNTRMDKLTATIFERFDRFEYKLDTLFAPVDRRRDSSN
jgi:hypothetical protein